MKLRAFTLTEMLVVLALSAIVITVAFAVFTQVFSMQLELDRRSHHAQELSLCDQNLRSDARQATDVRSTEVGFVFLQKSGETLASYTVNDAGVIREAQVGTEVFNVFLRSIDIDSNIWEKVLRLRIGPPETLPDTLTYHIQLPASAQTSFSTDK